MERRKSHVVAGVVKRIVDIGRSSFFGIADTQGEVHAPAAHCIFERTKKVKSFVARIDSGAAANRREEVVERKTRESTSASAQFALENGGTTNPGAGVYRLAVRVDELGQETGVVFKSGSIDRLLDRSPVGDDVVIGIPHDARNVGANSFRVGLVVVRRRLENAAVRTEKGFFAARKLSRREEHLVHFVLLMLLLERKHERFCLSFLVVLAFLFIPLSREIEVRGILTNAHGKEGRDFVVLQLDLDTRDRHLGRAQSGRKRRKRGRGRERTFQRRFGIRRMVASAFESVGARVRDFPNGRSRRRERRRRSKR